MSNLRIAVFIGFVALGAAFGNYGPELPHNYKFGIRENSTNCSCTAANTTCAAKQEELSCKYKSGCLLALNLSIECYTAMYSGHSCLNCTFNTSVVDECPATCRAAVNSCSDLQTRVRCVYDNQAKCGGAVGAAAVCTAAKTAAVNGTVCGTLSCAPTPTAPTPKGASALGGFIAALLGSVALFVLA